MVDKARAWCHHPCIVEPRSPLVLGSKLAQLRRAAGYSQTQLSARAGVAKNTISDIERGAKGNPELDTLKALAEALGVSVGYLVGELVPYPETEAATFP
jgi:transcriptional regulator with XRE-family HTH domain